MRAALAALCLIALPGCASGWPPAPRGLHPTQLTASLGETVTYGRITLTPQSIEDSRCPADATCVHQGRVQVRAAITHPQASTSGALLTQETHTWWFGHRIVLLAVCPYPLASQPARPEDKRIVLGLSTTEVPMNQEVDYCA